MKKIAVIMSDDRYLVTNLQDASYNSLSASINSNYCKVNGYDFIYYQPYYKSVDLTSHTNCVDPNNNNLVRHSAWSKLLSTLKAIELGIYDYIVYIDTDAILRTINYRIETIIDKYLGNNEFIFFDNSPNFLTKGPENSACSGFYILKVNNKSRQDIIDWYNVDLPYFNTTPFWEQSALWFNILKSLNVTIAPEPHFDEVPGQFLRHLHSGTAGLRVPYFTEVIKELNLDIKNNKNLNYIQYDTSILPYSK